MKIPYFSRTAALLLLTLAAAGCASGGGARGAAAVPVEQRAVERWQLLIAGDAAKAWDYLSAGVRSTKTREAYAAELVGRPVRWLNVEYLSKECASEDSCKVLVKIDYEVTLPAAGVGKVKVPAPIEESWVRVDGVWYYVPGEVTRGGLR